MSQKILYKEKKNCCGCGACMNKCPKQAISMVEDEYGFAYPLVDDDLCIDCGLCGKVCDFQNNVVETHEPMEVYAASAKNKDTLMVSSSGGIFALLAEYVLKQKGVVYGAAYKESNTGIYVEYQRIDRLADLHRIQGSKYVQSIVGEAYSKVKQELNDGTIVLFCGTPCQVAGLRGYLGKEYSNLFCADIVCHGVPNNKLFQSMIGYYEKKYKGKVTSFNFRAKTRGWTDYYAQIDIQRNNRIKTKYVHCRNMAYYQYFLQADICRDNCYVCKYANGKRVGDITLGDFWGVENVHKDLLVSDTWKNNLKKGISCVLVNTSKGVLLLEKIKPFVYIERSSYEKAAKENGQLRENYGNSSDRANILSSWTNLGYGTVQKDFKKKMGWKYYYFQMRKSVAPVIKGFFHRR